MPTFAQLCAIARRVIDAEPSIDDAEWRERIKLALVAGRLLYPLPHVISDAMDRAERALVKVRGARPAPVAYASPPANVTHDEQHTRRDVPPLAGFEAREIYARLVAQLGRTTKPRAMPDATPDDDEHATRKRATQLHFAGQQRTVLKLRHEIANTSPTLDGDGTPDVPKPMPTRMPRCPRCGDYALQGATTCGRRECTREP